MGSGYPDVRYRLQQIATKTGHDPRTFTGLVDLICTVPRAFRSLRALGKACAR
jgi:hypothetical protein